MLEEFPPNKWSVLSKSYFNSIPNSTIPFGSPFQQVLNLEPNLSQAFYCASQFYSTLTTIFRVLMPHVLRGPYAQLCLQMWIKKFDTTLTEERNSLVNTSIYNFSGWGIAAMESL